MEGNFREAMAKIDKAIAENLDRIEAGRIVLNQCNDQLRVLKRKDYALNRLKKDLAIQYLTQTTNNDTTTGK